MSGQSIQDRIMAAKHSIAGQGLAKSVCKATTEEVLGPKKKHLDYLIQCTNEANVSIPQLANLLIERTNQHNWVIVFKSLISIHHVMNYGNERFTQYLASNNCTFNLGTFLDKQGVQGYDMSTYIRRYSRYLNEKAFSYRSMAFDFCKVKRGKDDGLLRTMEAEKLLKTLPVLQSQLDALLEFDVTANELTNGVVNACFMLLFKDLIRLFACYNDGIINLLEKYFGMTRKQCKEGFELYKKFVVRMDTVGKFFHTAESVGIDKGDIPDLAKAPSSLLEALEAHLKALEGTKKAKGEKSQKKAAAAAAISQLQSPTSPTSGSIGEKEKQKILEEEQKELEKLKEKKLKSDQAKTPTSKPATQSPSHEAAGATAAVPTTASSAFSEDLLSLSGPNPFTEQVMNAANSPPSDLFGSPPTQTAPSGNDPWNAPARSQVPNANGFNNGQKFISDEQFASAFGQSRTQNTAGSYGMGGLDGLDLMAPAQPVQQPMGGAMNFQQPSGMTAMSNPPMMSSPGFDGFGQILTPHNQTTTSAAPMGGMNQPRGSAQQQTAQSKLIGGDLDSSLASLAGNLNVNGPAGAMKKGDFNWQQQNPGEKKMTGGSNWQTPMGAPMGASMSTGGMTQQPAMGSMGMNQQPMRMGMPMYNSYGYQNGAAWSGGMGMNTGMGMGVQPMSQPMGMGFQQQQQPMGMGAMPQQQFGQVPMQQQGFGQAPAQQQTQQPNDPFGAL